MLFHVCLCFDVYPTRFASLTYANWIICNYESNFYKFTNPFIFLYIHMEILKNKMMLDMNSNTYHLFIIIFWFKNKGFKLDDYCLFKDNILIWVQTELTPTQKIYLYVCLNINFKEISYSCLSHLKIMFIILFKLKWGLLLFLIWNICLILKAIIIKLVWQTDTL